MDEMEAIRQVLSGRHPLVVQPQLLTETEELGAPGATELTPWEWRLVDNAGVIGPAYKTLIKMWVISRRLSTHRNKTEVGQSIKVRLTGTSTSELELRELPRRGELVKVDGEVFEVQVVVHEEGKAPLLHLK